MIRMIEFASCYVYSPNGVGAVCERSRLLCALLKSADAACMRRYALRVRRQTVESPQLAGFFGAQDILVPVPGNMPRTARDPWAVEDLAFALVNEGLGGGAWPGLRRVRPVRRSATVPHGNRPRVNTHYESFDLAVPPAPPEKILLIDDIVTRGRTLLAAASRLHDAFPHAQIRAFALLRTMGFTPGVKQLLDPCKGEIRWEHGDAHRFP